MTTTYSQVCQDIFVSKICNKREGHFLEIGTCEPIKNNNTYLLENEYNWKGILVEFDKSFEEKYKIHRKNSVYIMEDATKINYKKVLDENNFPKNMDYLQIDLEVTNKSTLDTLILLNETVFDEYKFATVTFETDIYRGDYYNTREISRKIFSDRGYILVFPDISDFDDKKKYPFEDWYIHPDLIDNDIIKKLKTDQSLNYNEAIKIINDVCMSERDLYRNFINYLKDVDINNFRTHSVFNDMLEHNGPIFVDFAKSWLSNIEELNMINKEQMIKLIDLNDQLGNPIKEKITDSIVSVPNTIKYIYFGLLNIKYLLEKCINNFTMIEIGCGYGGQCVILLELFKIFNINVDKYVLIDLEEASNLQRKYVNTLIPNNNCVFLTNENYKKHDFGEKKYLFACYSLSEFADKTRKDYYDNLINNIGSGIIIWNRETIDLPKKFIIEEEKPLTGKYNKIVYF